MDEYIVQLAGVVSVISLAITIEIIGAIKKWRSSQLKSGMMNWSGGLPPDYFRPWMTMENVDTGRKTEESVP